MFPTFHQYYPEELYPGIDNPTAAVSEITTPSEPKNGFRKTGIEFFDQFLSNLYQYGIRSTKVHARLLGIEPKELCLTIQTLTGTTYTQFTSKCIILMTKYLLKCHPQRFERSADKTGVYKLLGLLPLSETPHQKIAHRAYCALIVIG